MDRSCWLGNYKQHGQLLLLLPAVSWAQSCSQVSLIFFIGPNNFSLELSLLQTEQPQLSQTFLIGEVNISHSVLAAGAASKISHSRRSPVGGSDSQELTPFGILNLSSVSCKQNSPPAEENCIAKVRLKSQLDSDPAPHNCRRISDMYISLMSMS